jgi:bacterioferritin-associated ferredoxin
MIVCVCHRVSDRDIAHAVKGGCGSFDELQDELRVATGCGACSDCARQTFEQLHAQAPCAMAAWVAIDPAWRPERARAATEAAEVAA